MPAEANREAAASFASRLTFGWLFPLLRLGASRPLEHADMPELAPSDRTEVHRARFAAHWEAAAASSARPPSFLRTLHRTFWRPFWGMGLLEAAKISLACECRTFPTPRPCPSQVGFPSC